jgi:hypothetical protein
LFRPRYALPATDLAISADHVRLVLDTAVFWLMHGARSAIPQTDLLATAEFATIRERLIKIGARVIEHIARIRVQLPTSCPTSCPERALLRTVALALVPSGHEPRGASSDAAPPRGRSIPLHRE